MFTLHQKLALFFDTTGISTFAKAFSITSVEMSVRVSPLVSSCQLVRLELWPHRSCSLLLTHVLHQLSSSLLVNCKLGAEDYEVSWLGPLITCCLLWWCECSTVNIFMASSFLTKSVLLRVCTSVNCMWHSFLQLVYPTSPWHILLYFVINFFSCTSWADISREFLKACTNSPFFS